MATGDMSIGIIARLVTDIVTFDRSVSETKIVQLFKASDYFGDRSYTYVFVGHGSGNHPYRIHPALTIRLNKIPIEFETQSI